MKKTTIYPFPIFIIGFVIVIHADIAPTKYKGWTLSPRYDSRVRMTSEFVDILWGSTCKVQAVFNLLNHTDSVINMKIGFPANLTFLKKKYPAHLYWKVEKSTSRESINEMYDFKFELNGIALTETDVPDDKIERGEEQWYGWECAIQPGCNRIILSYHVAPNPTSAYSWQKNLYYVMHTGKFWDSKIDSATVVVHFPEKLSREQIHDQTTPSTYALQDSSIEWKFNNFEPNAEHNVHLQITGFDTFQKIVKYKTALLNSQVGNKTKLDAAKFFASLTFAKGINFTAPASIDSAYYYDEILPNLSGDEVKIFQQTYGKTKYYPVGLLKSGKNYNAFSSDEEIQHSIKSALLRTAYYEKVEYKKCWEFVEFSKRLFREVITEEPKNVDAWLSFLENAYRIHPEGCNPCKFGFSLRTGGYFQNQVAKEAYTHCSTDPRIRAWYRLAAPHSAELPDTIGKVRRQTKEGYELLIKDQSSSGGIIQDITSNEFNAIKKQYRVTDANCLVKKNVLVDNKVKKTIVDILYKLRFYHLELCRELKELG